MNHRWSTPNRMAEKTERECTRGCGTIRTTIHTHGRDGHDHYVEFYRDGELIAKRGERTPACEPGEVKP